MTKIDKNSPVGLRLAYRFWVELGRPKKYNNRRTMEAWSPKIESLFRKRLTKPSFPEACRCDELRA